MSDLTTEYNDDPYLGGLAAFATRSEADWRSAMDAAYGTADKSVVNLTNSGKLQLQISQIGSSSAAKEALVQRISNMQGEIRNALSQASSRATASERAAHVASKLGQMATGLGLGISALEITNALRTGDDATVGRAMMGTYASILAGEVGLWAAKRLGWGAVGAFGLVGVGIFAVGALLPLLPGYDEAAEKIGEGLTQLGNSISNYISGWLYPPSIIDPDSDLATNPDPLVKTIHYVDPLILDLDGDGLEITALSQGVLFDINGDSRKTGTAWAGADDGLLVWDRDGNGTIDSGAELFGDQTVLSNGEYAEHGFAALQELDTGSWVDGALVGAGDGKFDASDAHYADVRVWQDVNQHGISQADELKTLAELGIESIALDSSGEAGSFNLAQNNFVREFAPMAMRQAA